MSTPNPRKFSLSQEGSGYAPLFLDSAPAWLFSSASEPTEDSLQLRYSVLPGEEPKLNLPRDTEGFVSGAPDAPGSELTLADLLLGLVAAARGMGTPAEPAPQGEAIAPTTEAADAGLLDLLRTMADRGEHFAPNLAPFDTALSPPPVPAATEMAAPLVEAWDWTGATFDSSWQVI